jgi:hypothetical protein
MNQTANCVVCVFLLFVCQTTSFAQDDPQPVHTGTRLLQCGNMVVEVGDPHAMDCRWNQGQRFSPVANVIQVTLNGREFCYAPLNGGTIGGSGGLPMEFDIGQEAYQPDPPGYNGYPNGSPFLKIGVGILQRNAGDYQFNASYPVVELAETTVQWAADRAYFVQTLSGNANGYAYKLEEDLVVKNDRLIMHYVLHNTGTKPFTTEQYLHNFMVFGNRSVGPNYRVYFPYDMEMTPAVTEWIPPEPPRSRGRSLAGNPPRVRLENMILYLEPISGSAKIWAAKPADYTGRDFFTVEQSDSGQRVTVDSTVRSEYVGIWYNSSQVSPEQFVFLAVEPGEQIEFTRRYVFSTNESLPQDCTADHVVDAGDLEALQNAWLSEPGSLHWDPACDISDPPDDRVDHADLVALADAWRWDTTTDPMPVRHWSLDELSGSLAFDNADALYGLLMNFPEDDTHWISGALAGALGFDGIDDHVVLEGALGISTHKPFAVAVWIKVPRNPTTSLPIMCLGAQDANSLVLEVDEDQRLRVSHGEAYLSANEVMIADAKWHHLAVVHDPVDGDRPLMSDIMLYVDGKRRTIYRMTEAPIDMDAPEFMRLGASLTPDAALFTGSLDEVTVFDRKITSATIWNMYKRTDY